MATLKLKINIVDLRKVKIMNFPETLLIEDACKEIKQKLAGEALDTTDFSLFSRSLSKWLFPNKCFAFYNLASDSELEFKSKLRILRVRCMDDAVKTMHIDESLPVQPLVLSICKKLGISNPEEYTFALDDIKNTKKNYHPSEDPVMYLNPTKSLPEQSVPENSTLLLRKLYHFSDSNIDCNDPIQLNLLYAQAKGAVVSGRYPCTLDELVEFASIQSQITHGNYDEAKNKVGLLNLKEYLPESYRKSKDIEKRIFQAQKKLTNMTDLALKFRYVKLCRSLKSYGVAFFLAKEQRSKSSKLNEILIGINKERILRFDPDSKEILQSWLLVNLRRWVAAPTSFTLDFGEYNQDLYSLQTTRGEQMSLVISGYIDILVKRKAAAEKVVNNQEKEEKVNDSLNTSTSAQGFTLQPAATSISVQETAITHQGNIAIPSAPQTFYSRPKSERKPLPRPKTNKPDEVLVYQLSQAEGPLDALAVMSQPPSPDTPVPDQETKACSNHSLVSLFSSFLASIVVLSESAIRNDADGILKELRSLVSLLNPLADACSKFPEPATQAAASRLALATRELFIAIEQTIRLKGENKEEVLDKVQEVTRVVHLLLTSLPSFTMGEEQLNALKINSSYLVSMNQDFIKRANEVAANTPNQATAAEFTKLIKTHSEYTSHLETILNTVSHLITTPHCSHQFKLALQNLSKSQLEITKLGEREALEESAMVNSVSNMLTKAYCMFLDQLGMGNFKKDIEIHILLEKIEKEGHSVSASIKSEPSVLISNTKTLTKTSADLVALLKRKINTNQSPDLNAKYKDVKSSLTECTTKMVECTKIVAANPNANEFHAKLNHAVDDLIKVAKSLIVDEIIKPSDYVDVPLKNMSITTTLLANHLSSSQVPQTREAVYLVKDCNKRYVTEYSSSAEDKRIVLANDMAVSARTLLLACIEDNTIEAPEELQEDISHCKETLGQLETGLEKYSDCADAFELNSMAEEIKDIQNKCKDNASLPTPSIEKLESLLTQLIEFRNLLDQTQAFLKVKPKDTGYSGVMRQILDNLQPLAQAEIQEKEKIYEVLQRAENVIQVASKATNENDKNEELNDSLSQLQLSNSALIETIERLHKLNKPINPREAILEGAVDFKTAITYLTLSHHRHKDIEKQSTELDLAFDKLNLASQSIAKKQLDPLKKERIMKSMSIIKEKKEILLSKVKEPSNLAGVNEEIERLADELNDAFQSYLTECSESDFGFKTSDMQVTQKLSEVQTLIYMDSSELETESITYTEAFERINGTAAVMEELAKQSLTNSENLDLSMTSVEMSKKLNFLVRAGLEASNLMTFTDPKKMDKKCKDIFSNLRMIENADSKSASIQSASALGHSTSALCIELKSLADSPGLSKFDSEKLNALSMEIAARTKDILLITKNKGEAKGSEEFQVASNQLRDKLTELMNHVHSSSLPIRETLKEVSNACKQFALCKDPEKLQIYATRLEVSLGHLIKCLQRATPGQQEISAAMDQILLGIAYVDDALLKSTLEGGLQIRLEPQPQLYSDVTDLKASIQTYKETKAPKLLMPLATSYVQLCKLVSDSALFHLIHKFGDSLLHLLNKKESDLDALGVCEELLIILELRKKLHQTLTAPLEDHEKDEPRYSFENLCTSTKSLIQAVGQGQLTIEEDFNIICGAVKNARHCSSSTKLRTCVDQALNRVANTILLIYLNAEKATALSSPISFLIAAVRECTRASDQCANAIKEIQELIPTIDEWSLNPQTATTPDSAVISKCGQISECLNSIMSAAEIKDETVLGDAVTSAVEILKGLLEVCSKSRNEGMKDNCKSLFVLWPPFISKAKSTLFKPETHPNWTDLKSQFENIQERIQNLHIQRLPDAFCTMTGHVQSVFKGCNFHPTFQAYAKAIQTEVMDLLLSAAACQKELTKSPSKEMYFDDGTWSEGLISAADKVVENMLILFSYFCEPQKSLILACAKSNQGAIKQLTSAATVRVDINSPNLNTLVRHAKKLLITLENLIKDLPDGDSKIILKTHKSQNLNQIALIEAQAEVFEIEKELEKARERYTNLKKKRYAEPS